MPRRPRDATAGLVFHVCNRSAKRAPLFERFEDYVAFERVIVDATQRFPVLIYVYCLMPNHWHFLLSPRQDGALSRCMHWVTTTHARRWQLSRGTDGQGAVYQGRFTAVPVCADEHFLWACRYVERNALRARLVERAEEWPWSSLWQRRRPNPPSWLTSWPVPTPVDWLQYVNAPQTDAELAAMRDAIRSGQPFGPGEWAGRIRNSVGIQAPRRPGRPPTTTVLKK
jgi:putative transposase